MQILEGSIAERPSNERIKKLEEYSRVNYPDDFVGFIKQFNGAIPETNKFVADNHEYVIERFLCITDSPKDSKYGDYDIAVVLSHLDERLTNNPDLIGDGLIPVAVLFAGDFVCLDYRNKNEKPSVCVWNHEESEEFSPVTYFVASDFSEFLDMLKK